MSLLSGQGRAERVREGSIEPGVNGSAVVVTATDAADPCSGAPGICMVLTCRMNLIMTVKPTAELRGQVQASFHVPGQGGRGLTMPASRTSQGKRGTSKQDQASDEVADAVVRRALELEERYGSTCLRDVPVEDYNAMGAVLGVSRQCAQQWVTVAIESVREEVKAVRGEALGSGKLVQIRKKPAP